MDTPEIAQQWRVYNLQYEAARRYRKPYELASVIGGPMPPNPILERILPGVLYVQAVAHLDGALDAFIEAAGVTLPTGSYRADLNGRIKWMVDNGMPVDGASLHQVRQRRNAMAHDAEAVATWDELAAAVSIVHAALEALHVVGPRPKLDYYGERSAWGEPLREDAISSCTYRCGITVDGKPGLVWTWQEHMMKSSS